MTGFSSKLSWGECRRTSSPLERRSVHYDPLSSSGGSVGAHSPVDFLKLLWGECRCTLDRYHVSFFEFLIAPGSTSNSGVLDYSSWLNVKFGCFSTIAPGSTSKFGLFFFSGKSVGALLDAHKKSTLNPFGGVGAPQLENLRWCKTLLFLF